MNAELFRSHPPTNTPNVNRKIAIIGGGISSICLSHQLLTLLPDADISLFCSDNQLASRGSSNQQGAIYPLLQGGQFSVLAELYDQCYPYAVAFYKRLSVNNITFSHQWCGVLQQAFTQELAERLQQIACDWPKHAEYIDAEQSSAIAKLPLPFASLYFKNGGWLSPKQFCQHSASYLEKQYKFNIYTNHKISQIKQLIDTPNQGQWQLNGDPSSTIFDQVVICSGHLANQYEQTQHLDIIPIRGQVSQLGKQSSLADLNTVICHKGYITPVSRQHQSFGATFDRSNTNEQASQQDDIRNLNQLKQVYSTQAWADDLTPGDILTQNAAIRATSQDHHPIVGEVMSNQWVKDNVDKNNGNLKRLDKVTTQDGKHPNSDNQGLYIMTGLGARGLTTAPLMAKHLAALMCDKNSPLTPRLIKSISPMRFQIRQLKRNKSQ